MTKPFRFFLVLVVMICFAANSVATRYVVSRGLLDAAAVTLARFIAGAITLGLILAQKGRAREATPRLADCALIVCLGVYAIAIAYGYRFITAAAGTFVFYAVVIVTMTAGGSRPTLRPALGAVVALAGVALLAVGRVEGTTPLGVFLLASTGAAWGAYSLLLRRRGAALVTNARAFVGFALILPIVAWIQRDALVFSSLGLGIGLGMGALTTALAYALWAYVLPTISPIEAGTFQLLVPVITATAGVILLGEPFSLSLAGAGALVLVGMFLTGQSKKRPLIAPASSAATKPTKTHSG